MADFTHWNVFPEIRIRFLFRKKTAELIDLPDDILRIGREIHSPFVNRQAFTR